MYLNPINELVMFGVFDRGESNKERIVFRVQSSLNLAAYGVVLTIHQGDNWTPLPDQFFWFGETLLDAGTWLYLYTGRGLPRMTTSLGTNEPAYVIHWNRETVIFKQDNLYPTLIRMDAACNAKSVFPPLLQSK